MRIYIIRHGETARNRQGVLQGRSDVPLNENGIRQAEQAGRWFRQHDIRFAQAYASPLIRAVETARLAGGCDVITDERLIEMDYGPYEGMSLKDPDPEIRRFFSDFVHQPAPEGMEALADVTARLGVFLEELKNSGVNGNIMISTHAIAMKGALEYLTPASAGSYWSKYIGNCAVYSAELTAAGFTVPVPVPMEE
ncbi:MAG: histidine phosphatase family protein [Solobacterium sp.]|nr:histidine phosphatase family protein [Solobacterium sp.]MBQ6356882.1 histidine phosphatase family protein [Solobacterium sp.]MBQ6532926.1 histidine phosphatase family protein [Solobacterium sp.]